MNITSRPQNFTAELQQVWKMQHKQWDLEHWQPITSGCFYCPQRRKPKLNPAFERLTSTDALEHRSASYLIGSILLFPTYHAKYQRIFH
jgi:hypothetical protein